MAIMLSKYPGSVGVVQGVTLNTFRDQNIFVTKDLNYDRFQKSEPDQHFEPDQNFCYGGQSQLWTSVGQKLFLLLLLTTLNINLILKLFVLQIWVGLFSGTESSYIKSQEEGEIWSQIYFFLLAFFFNRKYLVGQSRQEICTSFPNLVWFLFWDKNSMSYEGFDLEKCLTMKEFCVNFSINIFVSFLSFWFEIIWLNIYIEY